ncbi:hypothetical protein [Rubricoccus marinus]|uniref:DUF2059 domain-containing protein n=1 Tax=Rubricoccus marinus TaxID=716817 RepID=A0A259TYI8_9BACT|nr:hypothetical protein [Rubricoccus marinus]OZC02756.1 hypothetical protein BSZ36_07080 [Rubricoccus marinus]
MNGLRSPFLRRLIACLALAGFVLPLAPTASARGAATERLTNALGHREAVEIAMAASQHAANPEQAFLSAYFAATGQDADEVLARLGGEALWLLAEPLSPLAVMVAGGTSSVSPAAGAGSAVLQAPASGDSHAASAAIFDSAPEARTVASPRALQPRGP